MVLGVEMEEKMFMPVCLAAREQLKQQVEMELVGWAAGPARVPRRRSS